jgi:aminopeptidase N
VWEMPEPMATYLATVVVGDLTRVDRGTAGTVVLRDYLPPGLAADPPALLDRVGEMIEFFSATFGPFPFAEYGHAIVAVPEALEDQTLCILGWGDRLDSGDYDEGIVSHELSHQWFGDSVTPASWQDIWLNEGFATFAQWLWLEHTSGAAAYRQQVEKSYQRLVQDGTLPGDPGRGDMFSAAVYQRGALTLHALRREVGDDLLFEILRAWTGRHAYGNASTADFIALAEEVGGRDLAALFQAWLYEPAIPELPGT